MGADVLQGCSLMFGRCMDTTRGNFFHIAACSGQFAICSAMQLAVCSKDCLPPLIDWQAHAIGDLGATLKCGAEFIACGIGGCLHNGGGGDGDGGGDGGDGGLPPPMTFSYEEDSDRVQMAETTLVELFEYEAPEYDMNQECKNLLVSCKEMSKGVSENTACLASYGVCIGLQVTTCSQDCVPALVDCRADALKARNFPKFVMCTKTFITCSVVGCAKTIGANGRTHCYYRYTCQTNREGRNKTC